MKKTLIIILIIIMTFGTLGCTNTEKVPENTSNSSSVTNEPVQGSTEQEPAEPSDPITLTALSTYVIAGTKWGDDPISQMITKKTGIILDLEYATGDFNEKLSVLLAASEYPDMIMSIDNYMLADMIDAEAALPLNEYLDTGGENIKKAFGSLLGAMKYPKDGNWYGFNKGFGEVPSKPDCYMQVQYALLKEFGYPKINTLDELSLLVEQYIAKYKDYKGNPLIGFLSPNAPNSIQHGINNTAMRMAGFQDDGEYYVDPVTYEATYAVRLPETMEYLKWLNKMYQKNLFSLDSFSLDWGGVSNQVAKGNVLCTTSPQWALDDAETALRTISGTPELCYAKIPIYMNKNAAENSHVRNYDSQGTWKTVITTNCQNPKAAFDFIDQMWSEEMQTLCWWGIEGDLYDVVDGKRVLKPDTIQKQQNDPDFKIQTGVGLYDYFSSGALVKDSKGEFINPYLTPEIMSLGYSETDLEVLHAYDPNAVIWVDLWPVPVASPWGFVWKMTLPRSDAAKSEMKIKGELAGKYMLKMVTAKTDAEFMGMWDEFVQKCKEAGIEEREKEVTQALKERMDLWYGTEQ